MKLSPFVAALNREVFALKLNFLRRLVLFVELIVDVPVGDARLAHLFVAHQNDFPCVVRHFVG